jgi:hypothetical protein
MINSNLLLDPESKGVFELLQRHVTRPSTGGEPLHQRLHEFGDVGYLLDSDAAGDLRLSLALPPGAGDAVLDESTTSMLRSAYQGVAKLADIPEPGYQACALLPPPPQQCDDRHTLPLFQTPR